MNIVIDTNIAIALFVNLPYSSKVGDLFRYWREKGDRLFVPSLWHAEIVSAIKKIQASGVITSDDARLVIANLSRIPIEVVVPDRFLLDSSFLWAGKINQTVAYDAQYLALAEHLKAEFWTADRKLCKSLNGNKYPWVHLVQS